MKHRQPISAADEQQLLEHFRTQQTDEPSAELDARILAAARAQARQPARPSSVLARLHGWLFGGAPRLRWSLALGSVALLGLGLSLSLRTLEQAPARYDSPVPAAPALQRLAAPAPQKKSMAESARSSEQAVEVMADSASPATRTLPAPTVGAALERAKAEQAPLPASLQAALQEVRQLRASGRQVQAQARLGQLQRDYPQLDLEAQLRDLPAVNEAPR